jgi:hypothetical protein
VFERHVPHSTPQEAIDEEVRHLHERHGMPEDEARLFVELTAEMSGLITMMTDDEEGISTAAFIHSMDGLRVRQLLYTTLQHLLLAKLSDDVLDVRVNTAVPHGPN